MKIAARITAVAILAASTFALHVHSAKHAHPSVLSYDPVPFCPPGHTCPHLSH